MYDMLYINCEMLIKRIINSIYRVFCCFKQLQVDKKISKTKIKVVKNWEHGSKNAKNLLESNMNACKKNKCSYISILLFYISINILVYISINKYYNTYTYISVILYQFLVQFENLQIY